MNSDMPPFVNPARDILIAAEAAVTFLILLYVFFRTEKLVQCTVLSYFACGHRRTHHTSPESRTSSTVTP